MLLKNQFLYLHDQRQSAQRLHEPEDENITILLKKLALVYQSTRSNILEDFKSLGTPQSDHQISHCRPTPLEASADLTIFQVSCAALFHTRPRCRPLALLDAAGEPTTSLVASATVDQSTGITSPKS